MKLPTPIHTSSPAAEVASRLSIDVRRAEVDPAGRLAVRFEPRRSDAGWLVRRCVVQGPVGTTARLYTGEPGDPLALSDGTFSGELDVADNYQPLYVPRSLPLVVVWTDSATGANVIGDAIARVELEEL